LRDEEGNEHGVFTGKQPRQAALKAANKGIFKGWKEIIDAPKNKPSWMPDKINKPFVKKEKVETIE
jgi:hypothetical protein